MSKYIRKTSGRAASRADNYIARYVCGKCGSTSRLFGQCARCFTKFVKATDVAAKSASYTTEQLYTQRG